MVLPCLSASAGPLDQAKAEAHLQAIAASDLDTLMRDYPDDADVDWVGGPQDGRYHGKAAIRTMWEKFIALNKGKPRPATLGALKSFANPKGTSFEAGASYGGAVPMKVWHVLVYRDGDLTTEIWQIAPALQTQP
jgi:hypothetical protein